MKNILLVGGVLIIIFGGLILVKKSQRSVSPTPLVNSKIKNLISPPVIEVKKTEEGMTLIMSSPQNNSTVDTAIVTVVGKTKPLASIFVNETELTADKSGNFSTNVILEAGDNLIYITANDDLGNYAEQEITVTLSD